MKHDDALLASYEASLRSADLNDAKAFQDAIVKAQTLLALSQGELAKLFGCSRATVNRWSQGTATPYTGLRKVVFQTLAKRARQRQRQLERTKKYSDKETPLPAAA